MRKALLAVLLSVLAAGAMAQDTANFTYQYNVDAIFPLYEYCKVYGYNNDPFNTALQGSSTVTNGGLGSAVNDSNATGAFANVTPQDILSIRIGETTYLRRVYDKIGDDNLLVYPDIDLSGGPYAWSYYKQVCVVPEEPPEDETSGWIDVSRTSDTNTPSWMINVEWERGDASVLKAQIQCRTAAKGAKPVVVYPNVGDTCGQATVNGTWCDFDTVGISQRMAVTNPLHLWSSCRVALSLVDDPVDDPGEATEEEVTVTLVTR